MTRHPIRPVRRLRTAAPLAALLAVALAAAADAGATLRFRFGKGDVYDYNSRLDTQTEFTLPDGQSQKIGAVLSQRKRWRVLEVDDDGNAVLELTIPRILYRQVAPDGAKSDFDSAAPEKAGKGIAAETVVELGKMTAGPVLRVKLAPTGKVLAFKGLGPVERNDGRLPFHVVLPAEEVEKGSQWKRPRPVVLEVPAEDLTAAEESLTIAGFQQCEIRSLEPTAATIAVGHGWDDLPPRPAVRQRVLPFWTQGKVTFDPFAGVLLGADFSAQHTLDGFFGAGTSYSYTSRLVETRVDRTPEDDPPQDR